MIDKELVKKVNQLLTNLYDFVKSSRLSLQFKQFVTDEVKDDASTKEKFLELIQTFIFDYKVDGSKTPLELFLEETTDLSETDSSILSNWKSSVHSIFRVQKVYKDAFLCYNLVNEKTYVIKTLTNFLKFKSIGINNYIFSRIASLEDYHIFIGNFIAFPIAAKKEMLEMAVMVQLENPSEMFRDNPQKLEEIYENNAIKFQKFYDLFDSDHVFTSGKYINNLISTFTEYVELGNLDKSKTEGKILKPEQFYFDPEVIAQFENNNNPTSFISNYSLLHDTGIIFDEKEGLSIFPYYATFTEIFSNANFKEIKGYKECVMYYLENESISPFPFVKVITSYPVNSVKVFEDVLEHPFFSAEEDFDQLMEEYKYDYLYNNKVSQTVVFDQSASFKEMIDFYEGVAYQEEVVS